MSNTASGYAISVRLAENITPSTWHNRWVVRQAVRELVLGEALDSRRLLLCCSKGYPSTAVKRVWHVQSPVWIRQSWAARRHGTSTRVDVRGKCNVNVDGVRHLTNSVQCRRRDFACMIFSYLYYITQVFQENKQYPHISLKKFIYFTMPSNQMNKSDSSRIQSSQVEAIVSFWSCCTITN